MFKVVAATIDSDLADRVIKALDGLASVVRGDPDIHSLRDIVTRTKPDLILFDTDPSSGGADFPTTMQALRDLDVERPVIAVGDDTAAQAVLAAIRAGARDFVAQDAGSEQLRSLIAGHLGRTPRRDKSDTGHLTGVMNGGATVGGSAFAISYAATRAAQGHDVLLIDCNLPSTEAGAALDIEFNYTVRDAIHDLSRVDRTLLSSTLSRHQGSGLYVLPLALAGEDIGDLTPSAILSMLLVMRGLFSETIINVGGIRHAGLLTELLLSATQLYLVVTQKFTSLKLAKELLSQLSPGQDELDRITLVVDDYHDEVTLTEQQIADAIGLSRSTRLPTARAALINALNRGKPLVLAEPRHAYTRAIAKLAGTDKPTAVAIRPERRRVVHFIGRLGLRGS